MTLLVTVPISTLDGNTGVAWDEYDTLIPGTVARGIAAHSTRGDLVRVLHDGPKVLSVGNVTRLDLGRSSRIRSHAQYAALLARDGHCRWPGCRVAAVWCQVDHAVPWEHGGVTDLINIWLLCWMHHREKHRAGTECVLGPAGTNGPVEIHLPNGVVLVSAPAGPITR